MYHAMVLFQLKFPASLATRLRGIRQSIATETENTFKFEFYLNCKQRLKFHQGPITLRLSFVCVKIQLSVIVEQVQRNLDLTNLDITNDILRPGQSYSKMYGIGRRYNEFFDITNISGSPNVKSTSI